MFCLISFCFKLYTNEILCKSKSKIYSFLKFLQILVFKYQEMRITRFNFYKKLSFDRIISTLHSIYYHDEKGLYLLSCYRLILFTDKFQEILQLNTYTHNNI